MAELTLKAYFKELGKRPFFGSDEQRIDGARVGLLEMENKPHCAFKCGPYAVNSLLNIDKKINNIHPLVIKAESTSEGTSLFQVKRLADEVGLKYKMAKRVKGAPFITPCVMHWKVDHFATIVGKEKEKFWNTPR